MKPTLYFFKGPPTYGPGRGALLTKYKLQCAVIDAGDNRDYPLNFIATLPLYWKQGRKFSKFDKIFGADILKIAKIYYAKPSKKN